MTETGIFGGSFNPIHNGHIGLADDILHSTRLEEIWFMVSPQNPLKHSSSLLDDEKRYELVQKALHGHRGLSASNHEFSLPKPSYTWETLQSLSAAWRDRRFSLIIGADNWLLFNRWYRHEEILSRFHIYVYPRPGSTIDPLSLPENVTFTNTRLYDVSSTEVRRRIACGESIDGLVPDAIVADVQECYSQVKD